MELSNELKAFQRLSDILDTLRRECPWDRVQTMKSLRYLTIEEVHELSEAIVALENEKEKSGKGKEADASPCPELISQLEKELGDLAMHILFYCKLAEEQGLFSSVDVYNTISDKLIARHPFIYDREHYHGENWEQLKMREGRKNVLEGVPDSLPSLIKAIRMQEKVAGESGRRKAESGAWQATLNDATTEAELGDTLFSLVDWARRHGINADDALSAANLRFKQKHEQTPNTN